VDVTTHNSAPIAVNRFITSLRFERGRSETEASLCGPFLTEATTTDESHLDDFDALNRVSIQTLLEAGRDHSQKFDSIQSLQHFHCTSQLPPVAAGEILELDCDSGDSVVLFRNESVVTHRHPAEPGLAVATRSNGLGTEAARHSFATESLRRHSESPNPMSMTTNTSRLISGPTGVPTWGIGTKPRTIRAAT